MFDLNPQSPNNPNHPVEKLNHNFVPRNHGNYRSRFNGGSGGGAVQFRLETMEEDSGICSPPLWRSISPPDSPVRFNNPRLLSPASRAQAIARGQREIMEMVENMPETSYELSLKDIVEQRRDLTETSVDETQSMEEGEERSILGGGQNESQRWRKNNKKGSVKRQESNKTGRIIVKNGSLNHNKGLMINMFFPFSIGSKKKKNKSSITTSSSFGSHIVSGKFSPKPELLDKSYKEGGGGGDRRDWWWKKFTGSSDGESLRVTSSSSGESTGRSGSSGSSGSSTTGSLHSNSTRNNSDCSHGCWSFFPSKKRKP